MPRTAANDLVTALMETIEEFTQEHPVSWFELMGAIKLMEIDLTEMYLGTDDEPTIH